jgi:hypothetical protein
MMHFEVQIYTTEQQLHYALLGDAFVSHLTLCAWSSAFRNSHRSIASWLLPEYCVSSESVGITSTCNATSFPFFRQTVNASAALMNRAKTVFRTPAFVSCTASLVVLEVR